LLRSLRPGMLLLADRNFYGCQLQNAAAATGADLLWRVKASLHLPVVRELPGGSFLAHVSDPAAVLAPTRRHGGRRPRGSKPGPQTGPLPGITVRVIEFRLTVTRSAGAGIVPGQLSFTAARHAARRTVHASRDQAADLDAAETEILACLIPPRQGRICPRAVNKPSSPWPSKHNHAGPLSQHASYTT